MTADAATHTSDQVDIAKAITVFRAQRQLRHLKVRAAAELLDKNRADAAEALLSPYLEKNPRDPSALNLMAEIAFKLSHYAKAEALAAKCVATSPGFALARYNYAQTLYRMNKLQLALAELDEVLKTDSGNFLCLDLKSTVLAVMGKHSESLVCRRLLVEIHPDASELWVKYGSSLRSVGDLEHCVAAHRKAIELQPSCGGAYWDLADLKTYRFSDAEIDAMQDQIARDNLSRDARVYLHFALGKAFGDQKDYAKSFENYLRGNALKRLAIEFDPDSLSRHVSSCKALFTPEFLRERPGGGCGSTGPIFIIGMQRAGSTLVEQILASHSAIEATAELPDISLLAEHIGEQIAPKYDSRYPKVLGAIDAATFKKFGEQYLETTDFRRPLRRPFFVDKMPYNFLHLGLIHMILPHARILDVRRHPMACCFSNFSMHFESGPLFAYRLNELGRAYSDYVELAAHFDAVLPGRIHRIFYENLVREPEAEIRSLLEYLDLPFEDSCLRFHENTRAMSSVSAEQVRKPISRDAMEYWRNYEPWLGPLMAALGRVLHAYPDVPQFAE